MRAAAIIVNLVQMVIVLAIFVLQGLTFGGWTILGLFVLLVIACFNLLVLLFHGFSDQHVVSKASPTIVKRRDFRVVYRPDARPEMIFGTRSVSILDIAESGLRVKIGRHGKIRKRVRARIDLLCGETLHVRASVIRKQGDEVAMRFKNALEYTVLLKEKQAVAALDG